jgi:hypothetical protein
MPPAELEPCAQENWNGFLFVALQLLGEYIPIVDFFFVFKLPFLSFLSQSTESKF